MKFLRQKLLIVSLAVVLSGCGISEEEHNAVIAEANALKGQIKELSATVTALEAARDLELIEKHHKTMESQTSLDQAKQEIAALRSQVADLEKKLKDVEWEKTTLELKLDKPKKKESAENTNPEQIAKTGEKG